MRVMVTGGSGQLGKFVCQRLQCSHEVEVLDLKSSDWTKKTVVADITSFDDLKSALEGQEAVVHLAGIPSYSPDHVAVMRSNVQGTYTLFEAAAAVGVRRVVFASSICAYGLLFWSKPWTPAFLPLDETHDCWPDDVYGLSKLVGDQICAAYTRRYDIDTYSLRLAPVLFPNSEKNRRIFRAIHEPGGMAAQSNVTDFGMRVTNASKLWSYVDSRDVAQAIELALKSNVRGHRVYNIGAANVCSEKPSIELVREYYPDIAELRHAHRLISDPFEPLYSIQLARNELGYNPRHKWREMASELDYDEKRI